MSGSPSSTGLFRWLAVHRAEWRFGIRITVAGVAAFALAHSFGLAQGYWAVFTAVLVTQASVGGSLKAALDRLIGTFAGAIAGALAVAFLPHGDALALGIALGVALAPLAILSALYPALRVAPVTAVILLLGSASAQEGPFAAALLRTLEVGLGGFVGLFVSVLVLPARAHAVMCEAAAKVLERLAGLLSTLAAALQSESDSLALSRQHEAIQRAFDAMEAAAQEADRERRMLLAEEADPDPIPRTLRRVYHDLVLIGRVAAEPLWTPDAPIAAIFTDFASLGASLLLALGLALRDRRVPPPEGPMEAALARAMETVTGLRQAMPPTAAGHDRLMALGFALEQLQRNLRDLIARTRESARESRKQQSPVEILHPPLL